MLGTATRGPARRAARRRRRGEEEHLGLRQRRFARNGLHSPSTASGRGPLPWAPPLTFPNPREEWGCLGKKPKTKTEQQKFRLLATLSTHQQARSPHSPHVGCHGDPVGASGNRV